MTEAIDWRTIGEAFALPFPAEAVEWRIQGKQGKSAAGQRARVVAYLSARAVQQRLDDVVGPGAWAFTWRPITLAGDELHVVKGRLSVHGVVREDTGTASAIEPSKGAVSDALKRCAVAWGIGRYLYTLPQVWVTLDGEGRIPEAMLTKLRAGLERAREKNGEKAR